MKPPFVAAQVIHSMLLDDVVNHLEIEFEFADDELEEVLVDQTPVLERRDLADHARYLIRRGDDCRRQLAAPDALCFSCAEDDSAKWRNVLPFGSVYEVLVVGGVLLVKVGGRGERSTHATLRPFHRSRRSRKAA